MISRELATFGTYLTLVFSLLFCGPVDAQIYFSDDFEDSALSEEKWEVVTGDWQVADGVYHQLSTADPWQASMIASDHWDDAWVEYTIEFDVLPLTTGDAPVNVLFRVRDPVPQVWADRNGPNTQMYRWIVNGWTNTESRPYIYNKGTATMLAQTDNALEVGTWHHIMLIVTKTRITGYVNDVQMFDVAHAEWTDGRVGIHAYSGMMDFDNLIVYGPQYMPPWRLKARQPEPADSAVGVLTPLFQWKSGETAATHDVYVGTTPELGPADLASSRTPVAMYWHLAGLEPGVVYFWRVDEVEADGTTIHTGDVWSFATQDVKAYYPTPADGSNTVALDPTLTWMPGTNAAEHHVYFGDSTEAVGQGAADADKGMLAETTFAPGTLDPLTTYFWRVDETIVGGGIQAGPVWSFTTYLLVEDFESYNDDDNRIYDTWIDGWVNETGSQVGYDVSPFAERTVVHDANQSMPLDYNNMDEPFYSEAVREFASAQDWTINGAGVLVLYVRGRSGNAAAPLYVAVEDTSGHVGIVVHPDPTVANAGKWIEWQIALGEFAASGVNMARIEKLYIGLGDRDNPTPGGRGVMFVDDILLAKP